MEGIEKSKPLRYCTCVNVMQVLWPVGRRREIKEDTIRYLPGGRAWSRGISRAPRATPFPKLIMSVRSYTMAHYLDAAADTTAVTGTRYAA